MKRLQVLVAAFLFASALLPACSSAAVECSSENVFCVGLVTDIGKINDKSFNQSAWEGIQQAQRDLEAQVQYIETADPRDYAKNIAVFGDAGYDVIVTVGFSLGKATAAAAVTYPQIDFIGVDQFQSTIVEGVAGLNFPEDKAGFLVGALAALMSKAHRIGAVCGTDGVPPVWRLGEGYKAGAAHADKLTGTTTKVSVVYHNNDDNAFIDPEWGAATAISMIEQGTDVVFGCGSVTGNGAITAAAQAGAFAIGVDSDQYLTLPAAAPHMLSSALKLITPGVFQLIKLSQEGSFPSGNNFGHVDYAPFHDLENKVPSQVKEIMEEIKAGLLDGSITTDVPPVKP